MEQYKTTNYDLQKALLHDVKGVSEGGIPGNIFDSLPGDDDETPVGHVAAVGVRYRLKGGEDSSLSYTQQ